MMLQSKTWDVSINLGLTFAPGFWILKFPLSISAVPFSLSYNTVLKKIEDYDNDGYNDLVTQRNGESLRGIICTEEPTN
ncbi:MAG: hypothetical protein IPQ04_07215 [Saprospiraceae bacterium]|nr:hypothetical protein [Saprospiraceae bacterium]